MHNTPTNLTQNMKDATEGSILTPEDDTQPSPIDNLGKHNRHNETRRDYPFEGEDAQPHLEKKKLKFDANSQHDSINLSESQQKNQLLKLKVQLTWKNVIVLPREKMPDNINDLNGEEESLILRGVSGNVLPGQFLSIIGSTGAGKTTLLQYLSGKMFSRTLAAKGEIFINGVERDSIDYSRFTAFVQQDNILMETLSIRESLQFAANVKSPGSFPERKHRVDKLIRELELGGCADLRFSDIRISLGQKKRASIGVELITNPSLIFVDEPTTGMDAYSASKIVEILKMMSKQGRTIVATIHQPTTLQT